MGLMRDGSGRWLAAVCLLGMANMGVAAADDSWQNSLTLRLGDGDYKDSPVHESFSAQWLFLAFAKPQEQRYTLGGGRLLRTLAAPMKNVEETTLFGRADHTFATSSGRWSPGLYLQRSDVSGTSNQGDVRIDVVEPLLHWAKEGVPVDFEFGYARSDFDQGFTVRQKTPAVGYSAGPLRLQVRGYYIDSQSPSPIASGSAKALETTVSLRRGRGGLLGGLYAQYLSGERVYPVDRELFYLIPMANRQYDSWRAGANFNLGEKWQLGVMAGQQHFATAQFNFKMNFIGTALTSSF